MNAQGLARADAPFPPSNESQRMTEPMQIRTLDDATAPAWDAFVAACPDGTFFHQSGWRRVIGDTLGHRVHFLYAQAGGAIKAVLPLANVRSVLFGNTLSSLPFCSYGGAIGEPQACRALENEAVRLGRELGVDALELRCMRASGVARPVKSLYETFTKPISTSEADNMQAIRSKQRNVIRKGLKGGLTHRVGGIDDFYRVYAESVRNLGTPVFPKALFAAIQAQFPEGTEFFSAYKDDRIVASSMLFYFRDSVSPYYWGGTHAARALAGNDYLCWQILCRGAERGCTLFDFGRSKVGTGSYQWKKNWGFDPQPLAYEYELIRASEVPNVNPLNPKYRLFVEMWKRLPLPVTLVLGPWLSRNLG
ncbi:MAG: FemAB family XrtA/PEP-CTERM system-associated protein [Gammaproteobacteria bacterium]